MKNLPKWEQLPNLDLYLDQVLLYVNQQISSAISPKEKPLTAAMVNNYVKHGYIPKPTKKKYNQIHLARLIILSICKPIFPISDIHKMMECLKGDGESAALYDEFVACLAGEAHKEYPLLVQKTCQTIQSYQETLALVEQLKGVYYESKF